MRTQPDYLQLLRTGVWTENPSLAGLFGLCPLLAISSTEAGGFRLSKRSWVQVGITAPKESQP